MAAGSITFLSARQIRPDSACMHVGEKKKRRRTDREAEAERKVRSKGKSCTKTNSCNPKVTMTDESSKEGLRWPRAEMASLDWRLAKLCSLRAVEGRVHRRRKHHLVKAICIGFRNRNRAFPTGSSWRHQATSPSNRRRSTAGELPAPLSAAALLDDDHFSDVKKKLAIA